MKYCKRCVMPNTKPGIILDEKGICRPCRWAEKKKNIGWDKRKEEFEDLVKQYKGKNGTNYDCIIPVSGGKDSTYQVWVIKEVYGMNPLCVNVSPPIITDMGAYNLNNLINSLGVDLISYHANQKVMGKLLIKALDELGEPGWFDHRGTFCAPVQVAIKYKIPLIIWGEDVNIEYGGSQESKRGETPIAGDLICSDLIKGIKPEHWIGDGITKKDLNFLQYPSKEELEKVGVKQIFLGYYFKWDGKKNFEKAKELGFKALDKPMSGNILTYDNIDNAIGDINVYLKYLKHGYWRPTDQCCYEIRLGRMTREEAIKLVNEHSDEFPIEQLKPFLSYTRLSQKRFWGLMEKWRNKNIWHKVDGQWKLKYPLT